MNGVLDGCLGCGEAVIGHRDGISGKADEGAGEVGILGLVLAAAAGGKDRQITGRCGYSPSPGAAVDEEDEWEWGSGCTGWGCVEVELVEGLRPVGELDLHLQCQCQCQCQCRRRRRF